MKFDFTIINAFIVPMILLLFNSILRYKENGHKIKISCFGYVLFVVFDWVIMVGTRWAMRVFFNMTFDWTSKVYLICSAFVGMLISVLYFFAEHKFHFKICFGKKTEEETKNGKPLFIIVSILQVINVFVYVLYTWYSQRYSTSLEAIIFTLNSPLKGAEQIVISAALIIGSYVLISMLAIVVLYWAIYKKDKFYVVWYHRKHRKRIRIVQVYLFLNILFFVWNIAFISIKMDAWNYFKPKSYSSLYEDYYVEPDTVSIQAEGDKKNLILIFMESMETTYMSSDMGGVQKENYIPNLSLLAKENVSFSNKEEGYLGGNVACTGTGYTNSATFAVTAGISYKFPTDLSDVDVIAKNLHGLGDILQNEGYVQECILGSDKNFAGTGCYFEDHGDGKVIDSNVILSEQDIEEEFKNTWGVFDACVYDRVKTELLSLEEQGSPFALTFYTLDPHSPSGLVCPKCPAEYDMQLKNVLKCADTQIMDFISWCREQDFYDDTVIVIIGDHPRMDKDLVENVPDEERTVYNCFINPVVENSELVRNWNRNFTTLDLFPTILSAMGYEIPGNKLGLGVNLFSEEKTLLEVMGLDKLNEELSKPSHYYEEHFYY